MRSICKQVNIFQKLLLFILISIYILFLIMDLEHRHNTNMMKFISIVICFILTLSFLNNNVSKEDYYILLVARLLTIISDYFLLLRGSGFIYGVSVFCIVQSLYLYRHSVGYKKQIKIYDTIVIIFAMFIMIFYYSFKIEYLINIIIALYAFTIIMGTYISFFSYKKSSYTKLNYNLVRFGMILFLLCDINVGIFNYFNGKEVLIFGLMNIRLLSNYFIWFFYLPSQVFLSLSSIREKRTIFY
ncbi:lysoplasmalogenase family protein [Clostridium sp. DL1XJH146]